MTATNKHIPGKRLKTWHRRIPQGFRGSLRDFARTMVTAAETSDAQKDTAKRWLAGKSVRS